ncbi:MAG: AsmA family protein [Arenicellales bacterium]
MQKLLKYTGYFFVGLITLLAVTVIILKLIPDTQYKDWITIAAESATGRDVSIDALELDFGTALRVRADKVRMANADWSKQDDMLQIDRLEADFGLLALLAGKADIHAVVEHAEVLAEKNAEGISNWAMSTSEPEEAAKEADNDEDDEFSGLPLQPIIREIRIDDFKFTQLTEPDATAKVAHLKQLLIETPEQDTTLSLSADLDGHPVEVSANLGNMQQFLNKSSEPVQLTGEIDGNTLNMSGNWGPLFPKQTMLIDLDMKIPGTAGLAEYVGLTIEEFEPILITAKLVGDGDMLSMNPIIIDLSDPTAELKIRGSIDDLTSMHGIKMTTDANTESLENLLKQLHVEVPFALPPEIKVSAQINGGLEDLALSELVIESRDEGMDMKATASIGDLLKLKKIDVQLNGTIDSLSRLSRYAQTELPQTEPIMLNGTLTEDASKKHNYTLHAETGAANVDINGSLDSLAVPEKLELGISIKAENLTDFNTLAQTELPDQGPLDMSAMLQLQNKDIAVNDLKVSLKDQTAQGNMALKLPESDAQPTVVNGKLDISYLDFTFLFPEIAEAPAEGETTTAEPIPEEEETTEKAKPEKASTEQAAASERLFSSEPFLYKQLHAYDIDLAVNASEIKFNKSDLKDVQLVVKLKDGLLIADPITGAGGAGKINGVIRVDGQSKLPVMDVDISILEVPMPNLGGKLDFDADLVGKGKSVAELMGSLNGQMLVVMRDGKIEGALVQKFGSGLLSFAKDKGYTELECGILRVDVKDGIANFDKRLAAQLTEVTWRGGGEIDLKTEKLGIGIAPKPRKGIPISISGELSSLIYIGGTLKNPKVQLNPKDVAVKYAKYSAYVATGGLTYLAEVVKDKIDANKDVCELILDGTVFEDMDKEAEKAEKKAKKAAKKAEKEKSE